MTDGASTLPLIAKRLSSIRGIDLTPAPTLTDGQHIRVDVFATDTTAPLPTDLIGTWRSETGFQNTTTSLTTTPTQVVMEASKYAPVFLRVTGEGGAALPLSDQPWRILLNTEDLGVTGTTAASAIAVALPPNDHGQWGNGIGLWVADDGSTYFSYRNHLAGDFGSGRAVDLGPDAAMAGGVGNVAELDEGNNVYVRQTLLVTESRPNLVLERIAANPSESRVGAPIRIHCDVRNVGADLTGGFAVGVSAVGTSVTVPVGTEQRVATGLKHMEKTGLDFVWHPNRSTGWFAISGTADVHGEIAETTKNDNTTAVPVLIDPITTLSLDTVSRRSMMRTQRSTWLYASSRPKCALPR